MPVVRTNHAESARIAEDVSDNIDRLIADYEAKIEKLEGRIEELEDLIPELNEGN